jgi:carboxypeptidase Q
VTQFLEARGGQGDISRPGVRCGADAQRKVLGAIRARPTRLRPGRSGAGTLGVRQRGLVGRRKAERREDSPAGGHQRRARRARRLTGEILVAGQATKTLTELTDFAGPRLTGSDVHARAAGWAAERFRSYGVDATLEPFTLDHTWVRGEARAKMVAPREQVLRVAAIGWTPGTPAEGVRGEVVKVDDLSPDAVAKRTDLKGKIAFYDAAAGRKAGWTAHPPYRLAQAGAAAVVIHWARPFNALFGTACKGPKEAACSVPVFVMGSEDGAVVARLADAGPVTLDLASTASVGGPAQVPNVVA